MELVYCVIGGGPANIGNQETEGEDRGFVYHMPMDVSDATPTTQAPRCLVGLGGLEGPFGPEDSTHRDMINGTGMLCRRDPNGNYFLERVISRYTGTETQGRGGATGENQHLLNAKPPTKGN
jgi:hypothetical protein